MSSQTFYQIIILLWMLLVQKSLAIKTLDVLSHRCHQNAMYIDFFNLSIIDSHISVEMQTKVKVPAGVKVHITLERGLSSSGDYHAFFKYDIDYCRVIALNRNNLFRRWFLSLSKHGHVPNSCPWPVGQYNLRGWQLTDDMIPKFVVTGHYKTKVIAYLGNIGSESFELLIECDLISKMI